jgi:hypothetical protein
MIKRMIIYFLFLSSLGLTPIGFSQVENPQGTIFSSVDNALDKLGEEHFIHEDKVSVKFDGEFRHRFEYRDDFNFNDATFEDDGLNLLRSRLGMKLKWAPYYTLYVQGQDSESFASREAHKGTGFVNRLDLHQLYLQAQSPWEVLPGSIKVGRQELAYGDQRFVGAFDWSNVSRVFDAVKWMYEAKNGFKIDAWFSQVVPVNKSQADSADHSDNFYGLYTSFIPVKDHTLDTFLFIRHNSNEDLVSERTGVQGELKEYTLGNRLKGKKWNFDYATEYAFQVGSRAHDDIRAFAFHQELGYTLSDLPWLPRVGAEYNHGSGDDDATDGKSENFDNLFPTNHAHYGYMDRASLRNMNNIKVGLDLNPTDKIKMMIAHHWFFLDTNKSAWFDAGGAVIRATGANASTTVGQETDLLLKWQASKRISFLTGYSYFYAGAFLKDTGASDNANFLYLQTAINL